MLVEYDNERVLVTDQKLEAIKDVMGIMEAASKAGGSLVIIAEDITVRPILLDVHLPRCIWLPVWRTV